MTKITNARLPRDARLHPARPRRLGRALRATAILLATTALVSPPVIAFAADAAKPAEAQGPVIQLDELIVTAQKREENVQTVPISVTVVSAEQLARRGVQTVQDLSQASASLEFTAPDASPGGGGFVRGIGTQSLGAATAAASVSVVLDGVVLGATDISDIFDVERVEVLKGPQGTLFGSSVSAGVVSITTRAPKIGQYSATLSTEFANAEIGSRYDRRALRGTVNLPLGDASALRIAAYGYNNEGMSRNVYQGVDSSSSSYGLRVRYLADLTQALRFNLIADYGQNRTAHAPGLLFRAAPAGSPLESALTACGVKASPHNTDNCSGYPQDFNGRNGGASGQLDYSIGDLTLTSITSYRNSRSKNYADVINIAPDAARAAFSSCDFVYCKPVVSLLSGNSQQREVTRRNLFTQEVRLASSANARLEWVVGGYFQKSHFHNLQPGALTVHPSFLPFDVVLSGTVNHVNASTQDVAAFGNATYLFTPETRLIFGARFTRSKVSETRVRDTVQSLDPSQLGADTGSASDTDQAFTWRLGAQHDLGPGQMVYLMASTGYKAPQINDDLDLPPVRAIKAEKPTSLELGIKQALFDQRLYVNADVFYTRVSDFQTQSCRPDPLNGILCTNVNVPRVTTKGVEVDAFGRPFKGNTINVSLAYTDAKYPDGFLGADGTLMTGHQLNYAPRFKATLSTEQAFVVGEGLSLVVGGDVTYRAKQSMYLSALPEYVIGSQALFNARLGVRSDKGWSLFLFGRNLGDAIYPTQLYPTQAFHNGGMWHILDPNSQRVVGLQLEASF